MTTAGQLGGAGQLLRRIDSFEALELVLVIAEDPDRSWTPAELAARVRRAQDLEDNLAALARAGVIVRESASARLADDPAVRAAAADLVRMYRENPLPIVQQLTENAIERVRSAAARTFAEAFVVRRKDDG